MKILIGDEIKAADQYTILHEPISSLGLMERASLLMCQWIEKNISKTKKLLFLIGKGNNGGDGLAIARLLHNKGFLCSVYIPFKEKDLTQETYTNFKRLPHTIYRIFSLDNIQEDDIIIDALLGTGMKGELKHELVPIISCVNNLSNCIISIDIPSGMKTEWNNNSETIIHAHHTLVLEFPKLAMLLPEAGECCGNLHIISIGLDKKILKTANSSYFFVTKKNISSLLIKRKKFAYKNMYGHCLLICGSKHMPGAAILATGAALRSGCGLVTIHIPYSLHSSIMNHYPSAILSLDEHIYFSSLPSNIEQYSSIGVGCGLKTFHETIKIFETLLDTFKNPMVIDADGLNIIAKDKSLLLKIPPYSILTPHLGELKRLVGNWKSEQEKIELAIQLSATYKLIIIIKGAYSMIICPDKTIYVNSTGNSGMAKGGSGDVLTGIITGLLSQGYDSIKAALIGVYIHGLAGDEAVKNLGIECMNSFDIITFLPKAFQKISLSHL